MNSELNKLLIQIIIAVLPILTAFFVRYLNIKTSQLKDVIKNKKINDYIDLADKTIQDIVIQTNQTFVDTFKKTQTFDENEQKEAFKITKTKIMKILTKQSKEAIKMIYGDLDSYINTKIEVGVNQNKKN